MSYSDKNDEWTKKDGTLSDKTAFKEFGLAQNDIINAINEGKLQFREGSIYGNPYFRLLRSEVEKLAEEKFGKNLLSQKKAMNELKKINKELKELKSKIEKLELRKNELTQIIKTYEDLSIDKVPESPPPTPPRGRGVTRQKGHNLGEGN